MNDQRIWVLVGRYLAGEASHEELLELEQHAQDDDNLPVILKTMAVVWGLPLQEDHTTTEEAFKKHVAQHLLKLTGKENDSLPTQTENKIPPVSSRG